MPKQINFFESGLTETEQKTVEEGFIQLSKINSAPEYQAQSFKWVLYDNTELQGVLTASLLWDWLYIDELWVAESVRGNGFGKKLMVEAERFSMDKKLSGIWLWTQSWQAETFYKKMGFVEFARFSDFPKGYERIGLRKECVKNIKDNNLIYFSK